jgi:hypothetical protein
VGSKGEGTIQFFLQNSCRLYFVSAMQTKICGINNWNTYFETMKPRISKSLLLKEDFVLYLHHASQVR